MDAFRSPAWWPRATLMALTICAAAAHAAGPRVPLPAPYYSFDLASPTVQAGIVGAADILEYGLPFPTVVVHGYELGLFSPLDDLDGLAFGRLPPPGTSVSLLFSVDRGTVGVMPPDPLLVPAGIPFNAQDQAARHQAAGDEFMSLETFPLALAGRAGGPRATNNTLVRNNFDEGGTSYTAQPPTSAQDYNAADAPQDNVDASAAFLPPADGGTLTNVYFSATSQSPSLPLLPGGSFPSGAHIFYNFSPREGFPTELYAAFYQLGLVQQDDIDALLIHDGGRQLGVFDEGDFVLFSLTPWSPSLGTLPGHSVDGAAADVYIARFGQPPTIFASAAVLGLGHPADNIDALDFFVCDDGNACAVLHGIQSNRGDLNCDGVVDFDDINPFVLALSAPEAYPLEFPWCNLYNGDTNCDTWVDFDDINPFVECLGVGCPCP
jgi:hypothetical protein